MAYLNQTDEGAGGSWPHDVVPGFRGALRGGMLTLDAVCAAVLQAARRRLHTRVCPDTYSARLDSCGVGSGRECGKKSE